MNISHAALRRRTRVAPQGAFWTLVLAVVLGLGKAGLLVLGRNRMPEPIGLPGPTLVMRDMDWEGLVLAYPPGGEPEALPCPANVIGAAMLSYLPLSALLVWFCTARLRRAAA